MREGRFSFCHVTTFYPPLHFGGDAVVVHRLTSALARAGHDVTVVHSADAYRTLTRRTPAAAAHEEGVRVHTLRRRFQRSAALASYLGGRPAFYRSELAETLDAGFDVVNFHNVSLMGGPDVLRYGSGLKVYTVHEHWLVCPMHVLFRDNREPCLEPHCLRCTLRFRRPPQLWRYTGALERAAAAIDVFVAPSRFTIEAHRARGFDRPMIKLPPFVPATEVGADVERFDNGGRPYFLFVGRLERLKGVQVLIDVFRDFRDADLLVVGEGTHGDELRRQAAGLDHVRFEGHVDSARLDALYAGATALVVPSIGYETFGLVGVEAMARGTPAIVHDLGALPELIEDSGGGLIYRTEDELVAAMRSLLGDAELRRELGEKGRAAWREQWSEEAYLRGYFAAIAEARRA
jgi:glycosyltransferase involved in cell wall biosynthesis